MPATRIAITGASGFIGRTLVARVREAGHEAVPLSRADGSLASYEDSDALARALAGCDVVVHAAARAHRGGTDADFECNVTAARAVAKASRATGARLVLLSSIGVNGNVTHEGAFTEEDAPAPVEPYARSKLRAEQAVQQTGGECVIVRPPLVYGPDAPGNFGRLVRMVAKGLPLPLGSISNQRSLVEVDNLADAIIACATRAEAANELFLIADHEDLATPEIIECIARGLGKRAHLWPFPPALLRLGASLAGRPRVAESLCDSLRVDASKARRVLGWSPAISTHVGIERAAAAWSAG